VVLRQRKHASPDDEVKGADDPSLNSDSNDDKTVHGGLGCDHQKRQVGPLGREHE